MKKGSISKRGIATIESFFIKKSRLEPVEIAESSSSPPSTSQNIVIVGEVIDINQEVDPTAVSNDERDNLSTPVQFSSDIGCYLGQQIIDDFTKAMLLERHWTPPSNYIFPYSVVTKNGKPAKKYAQRSHLEKFHWLALSHKDQGLYCKYCFLFVSGLGGSYQTNTLLGRLVKAPLQAFDDLLGKNGALLKHQQNHYHQKSVEVGKNFLRAYHQPEFEVANQVCTQRKNQIKENRERLRPIVSSIIFCGRQNISLRAHRDDGMFLHPDTDADKGPVANDGNFRALLRFRVDSGDLNLRHHLETASSNATYISKTTQNHLIAACKDEIQETILARVRNARFFSILFDETTDVSATEQLSLSFRYLHNGQIREDFITFCDAYEEIRSKEACGSESGERRLTGVNLAHIVEDLCKKFNIDLKYCVGIGTDSCSVMASDSKGAVQELIKTAIHAKRCPCSNHILNNSLARSSTVALCRNASANMKKVVAFANASAKRHRVFLEELGGSLQGICETRWVERHDGHLQFQNEELLKICDALDIISSWEDAKTASDAQCLRQALCSTEFIISSICLSDVLGKFLIITYYL